MENGVFTFNYCGKSISLALPNHEDHIQKKIITSKNFYEIDVLEELARFPERKGIACDIGANIGNHAVYFAAILDKKVLAFEPVPSSYKTLAENIQLNDLSSLVTTYPLALGDKATKATIAIDNGNIGASRILKTEEGDTEVVTLDSLIDEEEIVAIMKIDVEGFELNVLGGAAKTIEKSRPLLIVETQTHIDYIKVFKFLNKLGYTPVSQKGATNTVFFVHKDETLEGSPFYSFLSRIDNQISSNANLKRYREILASQKDGAEIITKEFRGLSDQFGSIRDELLSAFSDRSALELELASLRASLSERLDDNARLGERLSKSLSESKLLEGRLATMAEELEVVLKDRSKLTADVIRLREDLSVSDKKSLKFRQDGRIKEDVIKGHLSYRIGNVIIKNSNLKDFWKIPSMLITEYASFKRAQNGVPAGVSIVRGGAVMEGGISSSIKLSALYDAISENKKLLPDKLLIAKSILSGFDIKQINEDFESLHMYCTKLDVNAALYQKTISLYKNQSLDKPRLFLADEVVQFIHYYLQEEDNATLKMIIDERLSFLSAVERKSFIHLLPIYEEFYSTKELELIVANRFTPSELIHDSDFVTHLVKAPLYYSKFVDKRVLGYLSGHFNKYENILAYFLYQIIVRKEIDLETVMLYFKIGRKHKLKFINTIRRFSSDIQNSHTLIMSDIKDEVKMDVDYIYLGMIKPKIGELSDLNVSSDMSIEARSYLLSNYGQNDLLRKYLNGLLDVEGLAILSESIDATGIGSLYKAMALSINSSLSVSGENEELLGSSIELEKISVIIATYNPDIELLELSIRSIQEQSYKNLEIIVVDDDSTNSSEIKELLSKCGISKYHRNENNSGPYISRNIAIAMADGDYIAFQDDDDISHPQRLAYQIAKLRDTGANLITVSHIRFDQNACVQIDLAGHYVSDGPVTMVFRKDLVGRVGSFKEVKSRGDVEFRSRVKAICGESSYLHCELPLYYSYGGPDTLSSKYEYGKNFLRLEVQRAEMVYYTKQSKVQA